MYYVSIYINFICKYYLLLLVRACITLNPKGCVKIVFKYYIICFYILYFYVVLRCL